MALITPEWLALPPMRTLYARSFMGPGQFVLTLSWWPIERQSWGGKEKWFVWSPTWHLFQTDMSVIVGFSQSQRSDGSWCYEPHETLESEIQRATEWAEHQLAQLIVLGERPAA